MAHIETIAPETTDQSFRGMYRCLGASDCDVLDSRQIELAF